MTIAWSEIEAEANASGFRERLVEVYRRYEGQPTDEKDEQNRTIKVTAASFARHMGVPERTFRGWVSAAVSAVQPEVREQANATMARKALRQASPATKREMARELLDDPEVASDPGVRARVAHEPAPERMAQQHDLDERLSQQRKERHGFRYMSASDNLVKIKRLARDTLTECQGVEFDAEERELLGHDIDKAIAALNLLKAGVGGAVDINWDAELAKLGNQS